MFRLFQFTAKTSSSKLWQDSALGLDPESGKEGDWWPPPTASPLQESGRPRIFLLGRAESNWWQLQKCGVIGVTLQWSRLSTWACGMSQTWSSIPVGYNSKKIMNFRASPSVFRSFKSMEAVNVSSSWHPDKHVLSSQTCIDCLPLLWSESRHAKLWKRCIHWSIPWKALRPISSWISTGPFWIRGRWCLPGSIGSIGSIGSVPFESFEARSFTVTRNKGTRWSRSRSHGSHGLCRWCRWWSRSHCSVMQRSIAAATMDTMDTMATMDTALLGFGCLWRCATLNNLAAIQGTCGGSLPHRTPVFVNASV